MSIDKIVTGYHDAMLHKSADELAGLYAEDALHEFPFGGLPPFEGREAIRAGYHAMWDAAPFRTDEIRLEALHRTEDAEVVVVEQTVVVKVGDQSVTVPGLLVLRIRDEQIIHNRDYMDTSAITQVRAAST
ncbi:nuclear transport factor 2 family protein [Nonomuraea zeae]|uniref:Nuclear transport factor 2 family protein n=1 Tax=Nonomuraea zeae TaxID=1642303 RepID=A0A5S4F1S6_9ACTN|nr:nuclear transport factor 2 family protein [Nonomuraea zeae]TMR10045.1 nuclear transport factor 2 family protein [Nonomuraea zeae]